MSIRRQARTAVALIAAYAVALQTILLVLAAPIAGPAAFAAQPICSHSVGTGSAPTGHAGNCLGACLTGCCCGTTVLPTPGFAVAFAPERALPAALTLEPVSTPQLRVTGAHRSRAPPLV
jgi:hypothetical protein